MKKRRLRDIEVSEVGMGCMAFSHGYGQIPEEQYSIEAIRNAFRHGCTFFDTAEVYSPGLSGIGHNERIVGKALKDVRAEAVVATKLFLNEGFGGSVYKNVRGHLEASLKRLQTDYADLYYLHRVGSVPVEKVAEAMGRLINEGLIRGWGLSQVDVDIIERTQRVTPLSAVQNLYSMVERDSEARIIPYCIEHSIGFVPFSPIASGLLSGKDSEARIIPYCIAHSIGFVLFSPIASGLLSGKITPQTRFESCDDVRNWVPQLSRANIAGNQPIVDMLKRFAAMKNAAPAQISLSWMLHKYPNVVPIPGSKNKDRIIENLDASKVVLTEEEFSSLEAALDRCRVFGHRGLGGD